MQKRAEPVFRYLGFAFAQQRCCRAFATPEREARGRVGDSRANAQLWAFAAVDVRSARRHTEEERGDAAQQRRLARFVVTIYDEEIRLALWNVDCPLQEVAVANQIDAVDSHADSSAERRASSSASASSIAVASARASRTIGSASSAPSLGSRFLNSAIPSQSAARAGSSRSAARARMTSPTGSSRVSKAWRSMRAAVATCT